MNRTIYFLFLLIAASCKRDALTAYNAGENVYFNYKADDLSPLADSISVSFAYRDGSVQDSVVLLPILVTGAPSAKDRPCRIVADPASTAVSGTHYDLPGMVIRAGRVSDTLHLRLRRAADLASGSRKLVLRLEPNEFFKTEIRHKLINNAARDTADLLKFTITISDVLDEGPYWTDSYASFFGAFSLKKVRFIHDLLGMPLDFWAVFPDNQRRAAATYYASSTSRYLSDQALQGNIIYDEDGMPMTMGPGY